MSDDVRDEMTRAKVAHLSEREIGDARRWLGVEPEQIAGPPNGFLIGEAPPAGLGPELERDHVPLFPFPAARSSARLMGYAGMSAGAFLGAFVRRNLFDACPTVWSAPDARIAAGLVRAEIVRFGGTWRALLLGQRVAQAFGLSNFFGAPSVEFLADGCSVEILAIPHPSGLNRSYNDVAMQRLAGAAVLWAAGLVG